MPIARTPAQVIAGEAVSGTQEQRWNDMLNIASVIVNRAVQMGVTPEDVVSVTSQFNAYGQQMPAGTASLTDMAQRALDQVTSTGPINNATYYATPAAVDNLPSGLNPETETTGHQYFSDPANRAMITAQGAIRPDPGAVGAMYGDPLQTALSRPYTANGLTNGVTALTSGLLAPEAVTSTSTPKVPADPAFGANGLLTGTPQTFAGLTPQTTGWNDMAAAKPISSPMDVSASGLLGPSPDLSANAATAIGVTAKADPHVGAYTPAEATVSLPDTQNFDMARFGDVQPSVANFDPGRFGAAPVDVAASGKVVTNPGLVAQANVPMMAAMFAPAVQQQPTNSFSDLAAAGPMAAPTNVTPSGLLGASPDLAAKAAVSPSAFSGANNPLAAQVQAQAEQNLAAMQAQQPSLTSYAEKPAITPAEAAINSNFGPALLSGQPIANTPSTLTAPTNTGLLSVPSLPSGNFSTIAPDTHLAIGETPGMDVPSVTTQPTTSGVNIAEDPAVSMPGSIPSLTAKTYPDQPTIAGPATTDAATQQTQAQTQAQYNPNASFPAAPQKQGILGQMGINKSMLAGGLLGGALGGPFGALAGGLLGNVVNSQGGLSNMFGNTSLGSSPFSNGINNIGSGLSNVASVYGGAPAGTQATTNNGGSVTSYGDGRVAYTNRYGVTTVSGPNGYNASYFGPSLSGEHDVDVSGYSPGLF